MLKFEHSSATGYEPAGYSLQIKELIKVADVGVKLLLTAGDHCLVEIAVSLETET